MKFNIKMGPKIKEITNRLEVLLTKNVRLGLRKATVELGLERVDGTSSSTWQRPPTTCLIDEPVHGRDYDKKIIKDLLLMGDGGERNFGVIPIVGIGGIGKTTLAQSVYGDDEIMKHFDPKGVGLCIESAVVKITIAILKALSPLDQVHEFKDFNQLQFKYCDGDDFNQVQLKLSNILFGKRFLLVLDDVWNINDYERWNRLQAPFKSGAA